MRSFPVACCLVGAVRMEPFISSRDSVLASYQEALLHLTTLLQSLLEYVPPHVRLLEHDALGGVEPVAVAVRKLVRLIWPFAEPNQPLA